MIYDVQNVAAARSSFRDVRVFDSHLHASMYSHVCTYMPRSPGYAKLEVFRETLRKLTFVEWKRKHRRKWLRQKTLKLRDRWFFYRKNSGKSGNSGSEEKRGCKACSNSFECEKRKVRRSKREINTVYKLFRVITGTKITVSVDHFEDDVINVILQNRKNDTS